MNIEPTPSSPVPSPQSPDPSPKRGRPRILDETRRREICALVAGGCSLREAARYVHCGINTIRRELERNSEFSEALRHSQMYAQMSPLRAMQQAVATHWRAAAWMLERAYPDRFGRRDPAAFNARQARSLMSEILDVVSGEILDPLVRERIEKRLRATFEYTIRTACDSRRTSRELRQAMEFFERKEQLNDPWAKYGIKMPSYPPLVPPNSFQPKQPTPQPSTNQQSISGKSPRVSPIIADLAETIADNLSAHSGPAQSGTKNN